MQCPLTCVTCVGATSCISCQAGLYLQLGACVIECRLDNLLAYYSNMVTMTCGPASKCPTNTFGYNGTKNCESSCPTQMYGNITSHTCENCPSTCQSCINATFCTVCVANAEYSVDAGSCYLHCNSTYQYSAGSDCVAVCPDGMYADYTNVSCQACNSICKTCIGNSLNCLSCNINAFLYNNTCLARCPSGYYGDSNNVCAACTSSVPSCSTPLTF